MKTKVIGLLILAVIAIAAPVAAQDSNGLEPAIITGTAQDSSAPKPEAAILTATVTDLEGNAPKPEAAIVTGTVTDVNGDTISGASIVLRGAGSENLHDGMSDENGFFQFKQLDPGTYKVIVSAQGFADWTSPEFALNPGQYMILAGSKLHIAAATTLMRVVDTPQEAATEQVRIQEKQRVLGIIPNFYVVYDPNPAPLTAKLKFHLALKTSTDVVTVVGVGTLAGINQAGNVPDYVQGAKGYGERFGAVAADGFSDIMIGGAILPSLLHQDPRYFYQGTGTNKSRALHALSAPLMCRGDNGRLQPNFSSLGGDLGSSALSNLYYPATNRGAGLVFRNFAMSTGERMLSALIQEFVLGKLTSRKIKNQ